MLRLLAERYIPVLNGADAIANTPLILTQRIWARQDLLGKIETKPSLKAQNGALLNVVVERAGLYLLTVKVPARQSNVPLILRINGTVTSNRLQEFLNAPPAESKLYRIVNLMPGSTTIEIQAESNQPAQIDAMALYDLK